MIGFSDTRTLDKDTDSGVVFLNYGPNVLLFKVINETNNWAGCMRFADSAGKPLKDLKVKTAP